MSESMSTITIPPSACSAGFFTSHLGGYGNQLPESVIDLFRLSGLEFASIGSGNGKIEKWLVDETGATITCVDPDPTAYTPGQVMIAPEFSKVDGLISSRPDSVGNIGVLLVWPSPNDGGGFGSDDADDADDADDESKVGYDLEAIQKLNPPVIVLMYASCGASGSEDLQEWVYSHEGYTAVMKDERPRETFIGTICYELLVLVRDDWDKADEVKKIFS